MENILLEKNTQNRFFFTSFTSGVVLRLSNSSRGSMPLRNETVRRRSCFSFDTGIGFTAPLLLALVLLLLIFFPVTWKLETMSFVVVAERKMGSGKKKTNRRRFLFN